MDHAPLHPSGPGLKRVRATSTGTSRLRVVPWQGNEFVAQVAPSGRGPTTNDVLHCLSSLRQLGVHRAVTPALNPRDARPFAEAGFQVHEHLHLLAYPLDNPPTLVGKRSSKDISLKSGRPWHQDSVIAVDQLAFEPFWQFDRQMLSEARHATPFHRFRVATRNGSLIGYAVTGRAGHRGYLQRLAVDPSVEGEGIGTGLVNDSLTWLQRRGAKTVFVNTQERNQRAFELYQYLGFEPQPEGLIVLNWDSPG